MQAPLLEAVDDAAAVPLAVHVTTPASWEVIQGDGFLRRMNRCPALSQYFGVYPLATFSFGAIILLSELRTRGR